MMKYASTTFGGLLLLSSIAITLGDDFGVVQASRLSDQAHICSDTGKAPNVNLGGYNVAGSSYASEEEYFNVLWNGTRVGGHDIDVLASKHFDPSDISDLVDHIFAIQVKEIGGAAEYRGIGVDSGAEDTDTEISDNEGIYISFGGLNVKEVSFGVRAFFHDDDDVMEIGYLHLYKDGKVLPESVMTFTTKDDGLSHDGQEFFYLESDEFFDGISFTTASHEEYESLAGHHDFFLEYLDLCYNPDVDPSPGVSGDPHFRTWSGEMYDFHGVCDLVLLKNHDFKGDVGMDMHVRTRKMKQWSYISNAAVRIGEDTFEIMGGERDSAVQYWINGLLIGDEKELIHSKILPHTLSGYPIFYKRVNANQHEFTIEIDNGEMIVLKAWKQLIRVDFRGATEANFGKSLGLMGTFKKGQRMARNARTIIDDVDAFGEEWQVLFSEPTLFHDIDGPQSPERCTIPSAVDVKRRLSDSAVSHEEAAIACSGVKEADRDLCIFDAMATNDLGVAGAY